MNSKLSQWCNGFIEMGWIAAIIAIPLFFNIHSDRVFEPDKLTLLRSIALLMSVAWIVKSINEQAWQHLDWLRWKHEASIWQQPFILPVFSLALVYLISTLFSVTPRISWAGSYQRLQGTYTTLSYIVIFTLVAATMRTRAQVNRTITAVIITSIPIAFYGMLQHFDLDPLPWGGDTQRRIAGHMGNAIFIAAYLIMAVPPTLARIVDAFTNILGDEELSYADVIRASIYIFTLAIQLLAIYWSSSRGPWLGLGIGLFAFVLILLVSLRNADPTHKRVGMADIGKVLVLLIGGITISFLIFDFLINQITATGRLASVAGPMGSFIAFAASVGVVTLAIFIMVAIRRGWRWLWLSWLLLALVLVIWLGAFNFADALHEQFSETPLVANVTSTLIEWKKLPSIGRLGQLIDSESRTGTVRVLIWEGALDLLGFHEPLKYPDGHNDPFNFLRPLIGYGPESMYVAYNRFYPPELATVEARNASPDRSHNETFDALVITGGLGFLVWQALYVSVFYFGFKWLGVVRGKRDRNLLLALWILGAVVATAVIVPIMGPPFFGVAVPFGTIIGLVLYLIYYALFAYSDSQEVSDPFAVDRLLMIALVTAVLAHYVEIHFGIAIAATRLHFFTYVGLMFIVGYLLPRLKEAPVLVESKGRKRRRAARVLEPLGKAVWGPVLLHGLMLVLMIGIIGFEYTTYSLPPDKVIQSPADITAGEIFHQSMFLNARKDFADSPFIFLMIMLTWTLGTLLSVSEMVKVGDLELATVTAALHARRKQMLMGLFGLSFLASAAGAVYLYISAAPVTITGTLGRTLLLLWSVMSFTAAVALFLGWENGRFLAAAIAGTGALFALPVLVAGGTVPAILLLIVAAVALYLLWDNSWRGNLLPLIVMAFTALAGGLLYAFLQANLVKSSIAPQTTQQFTSTQALRVFEASLATNFLTLFYVFVIILLVIGAFVLGHYYGARAREFGSTPALLALIVLFILAFVGVSQTNIRVIQADVVFKRGKPFDDQAARLSRNQETRADGITAWDNTIAIYEHALELAPKEDFYYLFLGRAYLERSTLETDQTAQTNLFAAAEERLLLAQEINPLNTDHTANLARLNTRLTQLARDDTAREARLEEAESYYQSALALSPQNSIIRNEYAGLTLDLRGDCEKALAIYDESVEIDPYFATLYFARADAYITCAGRAEGDLQESYYRQAISSLEGGLEYEPNSARAWLQLGQLNQEIADYAAAVPAFQNALDNDTSGSLPAWNINYLIAVAYRNLGETDAAIAKAQLALSQAPAETAAQVRQLLTELGVETTGETPTAPADTGAVALEGERPFASIEPAARNGVLTTPPPFVLDTSLTYEAIINTEKGQVRLRLFDDESPITVNNFVFLAEQGFYDGTTFHRVLANFMAQGGDPTGTGTGGPGYQFQDEVNNGLAFDRPGLLAMANAGPNTNGSQFFITYVPTDWLTGKHTIFGELIAGQEVLDSLTLRDPSTNPGFPGDRIDSIEIVTVNE